MPHCSCPGEPMDKQRILCSHAPTPYTPVEGRRHYSPVLLHSRGRKYVTWPRGWMRGRVAKVVHLHKKVDHKAAVTSSASMAHDVMEWAAMVGSNGTRARRGAPSGNPRRRRRAARGVSAWSCEHCCIDSAQPHKTAATARERTTLYTKHSCKRASWQPGPACHTTVKPPQRAHRRARAASRRCPTRRARRQESPQHQTRTQASAGTCHSQPRGPFRGPCRKHSP